jgi:trk system potassium uptake protein TrkA
MSLSDLELPNEVIIGMIVRNDDILLPDPEIVIEPLDHIILMARSGQASKIEDMFTVQVDLF